MKKTLDVKPVQVADAAAACREIAATLLSVQFSQIIRAWLTPEQLAEVLKQNKKNPNNCYTYNIIDANEAMDEAGKILGIEFVDALENKSTHDEAVALWNRAWEISRAMGFAESV